MCADIDISHAVCAFGSESTYRNGKNEVSGDNFQTKLSSTRRREAIAISLLHAPNHVEYIPVTSPSFVLGNRILRKDEHKIILESVLEFH